jgi:diadenosine tetraphosphatase ApaH/serine/threonine PP2A family protein phosphatase
LKSAVFSDIHGNLEALEAVLADAEKAGVSGYVCLGDIVGYGADPNECLERVRSLPGIVCLLGNHDAAATDLSQRSFFHEVALAGVEYTERSLTEDNRQYLSSLPYTHSESDYMAVHASPYRPEAWEYVLDIPGAERAFQSMGESRLAFIGHSHSPVVFCDDGTAERLVPGDAVALHTDVNRYIVNVGSVGQPRDGNPDSAYVIYDSEELTAELMRVEYDRSRAAAKILKAGLPPVLAERLLVGY